MSLKYYKYRLPFVTPLQTSNSTFKFREGFILEYTTGDDQYYGEVAPLPGYSKESLKEVLQLLQAHKDLIVSTLDAEKPTETFKSLYGEKEWPTSIQFGLDSLAYQIQAFQKKSSLTDFLFTETMEPIPVNALGSLHSENYWDEVKQQIDKGFQTIKFKIGIDFGLELERLKHIRSAFPDLTIRLDANQAWSTETALRNFQQLETLQIEYCEEPLRKATPKNYELLSQHSQIPLALDESVSHVSYWPNLLPFTSYIVLKPMLIGSFTKNIETKRLANTHNNKTVFTTSLESGVGRRITAVLASGLGSPHTAHGLTTGELLAKDVYSDMASISKGAYHLNRHHQPRIDFQMLGDVSKVHF